MEMRRESKVKKGALWIMYVLALITIVSCKKGEYKLPVANDPVFRVDGEFDGQSLSLVAGDDNAYMHTNSWEENRVRVYAGNLSDGELSIKMGIYDGDLALPASKFLEQLPSEIRFSEENSEPLAILSKDLFPNEQLISFVEWSINGGFVALNDYEINGYGKYEVCARIFFNDGSNEELCSELILGYKKHGDFLVKHFLNQDGVLSAWADDKGNNIEKVRWFLDEILVNETTELNIPIGLGNHRLRTEVSFANGAVRSKTMLIDGNLSGKFIDDLSFFEKTVIAPLNRDFNLWIEVIKDGVAYHSEKANNVSKSILIESVEYTGVNTMGNKTYRVKANVNAELSSNQGGEIKEASFDVVFGIEIP